MPKASRRLKKSDTRKVMTKREIKASVPKTDVIADEPVPEESTMGRYFTLRIQDGQNKMFAGNGPEGMGLTDEQLAVLWNVNWSMRKVTYRPFHIVGARRDFNKGKHGNPKAPDTKTGKWTVDKATNEYTYHAAA
jgi:hypothetical protein